MARSRASANYTITAEDRSRAGVLSAKRSFESLGGVVGKVSTGLALLGVAATFAPTQIIRQNAQVIDSYGKLSEKLGIGVTSYQAINDAAERAGIAQSTLNLALQKGLRGVSEAANGYGEAEKAISALGLSAEELQRSSPEERIFAILDALESLDDQGDKVAFAAKIFGSRGTDLVRLFSGEVRNAEKEIRALGLSLTEVDTAGVEAMNDELQRVQRNAALAGQAFTGRIAPDVQAAVAAVGDLGLTLLGSASAAEVLGTTLTTTVGLFGNGLEGLDNVYESLKIGLQTLNVGAAEVTDRLQGSAASADALQRTKDSLQELKDNLAGQVGDETVLERVKREAEENREAAQAAADEIERIRAEARARGNNPVDLLVDIKVKGGSASTATDKVREQVSKDFDSLLGTLREGSSSFEAELRARLDAADRFRSEFPGRASDALQAEIAAYEERDSALDQISGRTVDVGVEIEGDSEEAANTVLAGALALADAGAARDEILDAINARRNVRLDAVVTIDEAGAVVERLAAGTDALTEEGRRRVAAFAALQAPRVVAGVDLTDETGGAIATLSDGTRRLGIETTARDELLDSVTGGGTIDATVSLLDSAPDIARNIGTGTEAIRSAVGARADALAGLGEAANSVDLGVGLDFDIRFPDFSVGANEAQQQLQSDLELIAGYRQKFPAAINELAEAEVLAYARRDARLAEIRQEAAEARAEVEAPVRSGIDALQSALQTETQAVEAEYGRRRSLIREAGELGVVAEEEVTQLLEQSLRDRNERLRTIEEQREQERRESVQRSIGIGADVANGLLELGQQEVNSYIQINEQMTAEERKRAEASNRNNRKRFDDNKKYQSGQAIVNTLAGISQVIGDPSLDFYQKGFAIAAVTAQGAAVLGRIRAAEYGGGGSVGGVGGSGAAGGGGGSGSSSSGSTDGGSAGAAAGPTGPNITINVFSEDGLVDNDAFRQRIGRVIAENTDDGTNYFDDADPSRIRYNSG